MSNNNASDIEIDPRYENGKLYKIICNNTGRIYIGSTCKTLEERLGEHEQNYKYYLNGTYRYTSSFDIINDNNYRIELIKNFACKNRRELEHEEGRHQLEAMADESIACVNKYVAGRTKEEYRAHKREYGERRKDYFRKKFNCPCGGKYTFRGRHAHFRTKMHKKYLKEKAVVEKIMREVITEIVNNVIKHI
jgi:hypothetical protein